VHWDDGGCIVFWVLRQSVRNGNFLKWVAWELGSRIGKEVSLEIWLLMGMSLYMSEKLVFGSRESCFGE
jgi:hypothetical protein